MSVSTDYLQPSPKFSNDVAKAIIFISIMFIIGIVYSISNSEDEFEEIDKLPPPPPTNCTPKENLRKNDNRLIKKLINKGKNSFFILKTEVSEFIF